MVDIRDLPFPITVTEVRALGDYRLALYFQDGKRGFSTCSPISAKASSRTWRIQATSPS